MSRVKRRSTRARESNGRPSWRGQASNYCARRAFSRSLAFRVLGQTLEDALVEVGSRIEKTCLPGVELQFEVVVLADLHVHNRFHGVDLLTQRVDGERRLTVVTASSQLAMSSSR